MMLVSNSSQKPALWLLWRLSKVSRLSKRGSAEQGLTIMECLVAILLIGLTVAMVTPPLLIATATRVQNRRAEQAMQLAQDEIDRISTLVQQGEHESRRLPISSGKDLKAVGAPVSPSSLLKTNRQAACPSGSPFIGQQIPANQALRVDVDGDCEPEFFMQVFRTEGVPLKSELTKRPENRRPAKFDVGIRVYSALAKDNFGRLERELAPLTPTNGQGKQAINPLVVVYKQIIWGEQADALCESLKPSDRDKISACL
jgi:type II secretory pathway pseudopilin PulG